MLSFIGLVELLHFVDVDFASGINKKLPIQGRFWSGVLFTDVAFASEGILDISVGYKSLTQ